MPLSSGTQPGFTVPSYNQFYPNGLHWILAPKENTDQHFNLWSLRETCSWCCTLQWKVFETNYSRARRRLIGTVALSTLSGITLQKLLFGVCIEFKLKIVNQGSRAPTIWPVENSGTTYRFGGFSLLSLVPVFSHKCDCLQSTVGGRGTRHVCTPRSRPRGIKTHPTVLKISAFYCI